ncbi:MAG: TylF/MycF/NovP-related O-methyltransferase [Planctomycetota bacterium]
MGMITAWVKRLTTKLGFDIRRMPGPGHVSADGGFQLVKPNATYSPWNRDSTFQAAHAQIQEATLVDVYRCWELWQLVEQSAKLSEGAVIEIGVWRGGTGALIAQRAKQCGIRDPIYLCDTFTGVVKAGANDTRYIGGEHADTDRAAVERLLARMGCDGVRILVGIFPDQTGSAVAEQRIRFCHVDVDVYQSAKDILAWVWDRLVPGGIVVFDDYGFKGCEGVARLVEEHRSSHDRIVIHNLNGHAVMIRR